MAAAFHSSTIRSAMADARLLAVVMVRRSKPWSPRQADVQRIRLGSSRCGVPAKKKPSPRFLRQRTPGAAIRWSQYLLPPSRSGGVQGDRLLVDDSCGS